jgi:hypothetical protein
MADILIPLHDLSIGRMKTIPWLKKSPRTDTVYHGYCKELESYKKLNFDRIYRIVGILSHAFSGTKPGIPFARVEETEIDFIENGNFENHDRRKRSRVNLLRRPAT